MSIKTNGQEERWGIRVCVCVCDTCAVQQRLRVACVVLLKYVCVVNVCSIIGETMITF